MRIHRRIAVTGEMLGRYQHVIPPVGMRALDEGAYLGRNRFRVLAERADIDDRVVRIAIDVRDRIVDPLHAQRARLPCRHLAFEPRKLRIARRAEGHGVREHRYAFHPHGSAAFEIAAHHQRYPGQPLHAVQESGQCIGFRFLNRVPARNVG